MQLALSVILQSTSVSSGALAIRNGAFGDDTVSTILHSVNCNGNEPGVLSCFYSSDDLGTCSKHSAAVICQSEILVVHTISYEGGYGVCVYVCGCVYVSMCICTV